MDDIEKKALQLINEPSIGSSNQDFEYDSIQRNYNNNENSIMKNCNINNKNNSFLKNSSKILNRSGLTCSPQKNLAFEQQSLQKSVGASRQKQLSFISPQQNQHSQHKKDLHQSSVSPTKSQRSLTQRKNNLQKNKAMRLSCYQEKELLRSQIVELEEKIQAQKRAIDILKTQVKEEKDENNYLEQQFQQSKSTVNQISEYQQKIQDLRTNEINLMQQLNEQQYISREALQRLYHFMDESLLEKEQLRDMWEAYLTDYREEILREYEKKEIQLQQKNEELMIEQDQIRQEKYKSTQILSEQVKMAVNQMQKKFKEETLQDQIELEILNKTFLNLRQKSMSDFNKDFQYQLDDPYNQYNNDDEKLQYQQRQIEKQQMDNIKQQILEKEKNIQEKEILYQERLCLWQNFSINPQQILQKLMQVEQENIQLKFQYQQEKKKSTNLENIHEQAMIQCRTLQNDLMDQIFDLKNQIDKVKQMNNKIVSKYKSNYK